MQATGNKSIFPVTESDNMIVSQQPLNLIPADSGKCIYERVHWNEFGLVKFHFSFNSSVTNKQFFDHSTKYSRVGFHLTGNTNCWSEENPIYAVTWRYDWCAVCYEWGWDYSEYFLVRFLTYTLRPVTSTYPISREPVIGDAEHQLIQQFYVQCSEGITS